MRPFVLSVLALSAVALAGPGIAGGDDDKKASEDEKYQIKTTKFPAKDKPVKINEKTVIATANKAIDDRGNVLREAKSQKTLLRVYVEKTLDVDEKANKRKKYSRAYEKAKDVEGDESQSKPYQGRTIVFEKSDDKWTLEAEGKPELGEDKLKELADEVNKDADKDDEFFYPKKAVKVGEKWTVPGKDFAKFFDELKIDAGSVKAEGKLVKAYKKGKQQWGVIDFVFTFTSEVEEIKKAKGELKFTVDQALDASTTAGKAAFTLTLTGSQDVEKGDKKGVVETTVTMTYSNETTDATDAKK